MTYIENYDKNGNRDLISVKTTNSEDENVVLFGVFKKLSSLNNDFKSFYEKLNSNKEKIDFFYFEFPIKLNVQ